MIRHYLDSGYPALWIETLEIDRAIKELSAIAIEDKYTVFSWDVGAGFKNLDGGGIERETDPIVVSSYLNDLPDQSIIFAKNFHRFVNSAEISQGIQNNINRWKASGKCLIVVSPVSDIPLELERLFTLIQFDLPNDEAIKDRISYVVRSSKLEEPSGDELSTLIESGRGLTSFEIENALSLSVAKKSKLDPSVVLDQKAQLVKKNSTLDFSVFSESFDQLGGLDNLKDFTLSTIKSPMSRGIMLLGVPGTGKTCFCKALGNATGMPTIVMDFGRLFGSKVGQTEAQTRRAFQTIDAMAPCIVMIDEMEKGLSGTRSSNSTDGGTTSRVFGTFLQWLQDHKSRVYTVATINDMSQLPLPLLRAERWDAIFFVDVPNAEERTAIYKIWSNHFGINEEEPDLIVNWTGAEIRSLTRIAAMKNCSLSEARKFVVPICRSNKEAINHLRNEALQFAVPASKALQEDIDKGRKILR